MAHSYRIFFDKQNNYAPKMQFLEINTLVHDTVTVIWQRNYAGVVMVMDIQTAKLSHTLQVGSIKSI